MPVRSPSRQDVPVVPDKTGPLESFEDAAATSAKMGYRVMLKASAGGGREGQRFVASESELRSAFETARSEALSSFGDAAVYIEKAMVRPRHVEIQVFSDTHGNHVHLGDASVPSSGASKGDRRGSVADKFG